MHKLDGHEMNVKKNYAGKKILQIIQKITVDFVSVASSIYYCFYFWHHLW